VWVAARFRKRRRVTNPKEGGQNLFGRLWDSGGRIERVLDSQGAFVAGIYSEDGVADAHCWSRALERRSSKPRGFGPRWSFRVTGGAFQPHR
jgi:hypothetical protein